MSGFKLRYTPHLILLLITLMLASSPALAQERPVRHFGLTASLQGGQTVVLLPIWLGQTLTVAPGLALNYVENAQTTVTALLVPRFYLRMQRVAPYVTGNIGILRNDPTAGAVRNDLLFGVGFGGEYFVNTMFSFGVEGLLNGRIVDISGVQNMGVSTAAGVHANVYF